jgi:hypothetical protein
LETISKWVDRIYPKAFAAVEVVVSVDSDDPKIDLYRAKYSPQGFMGPIGSADRIVHYKLIESNNRSAIDAVNAAAANCNGDIMIVVSDDTSCPYNWDQHILDATKDRNDFVLRVNDEIQRWIITMPVIDRAYYNRFGYVYHPDYQHMFVDTAFTHVADCLGRIIDRKDLHFPHMHYSVRKTQKDSINERADATWKQGEELYLKHFRESFGLTGIDPWNISDEKHKNWLRAKL